MRETAAAGSESVEGLLQVCGGRSSDKHLVLPIEGGVQEREGRSSRLQLKHTMASACSVRRDAERVDSGAESHGVGSVLAWPALTRRSSSVLCCAAAQ